MIKAIKLIDYCFKFERVSFRSSGGRGFDHLLVMGNRDALVKGRPRYRESRVYKKSGIMVESRTSRSILYPSLDIQNQRKLTETRNSKEKKQDFLFLMAFQKSKLKVYILSKNAAMQIHRSFTNNFIS